MPTVYCEKLMSIAQNEFHAFNFYIETEAPLLNRIKKYYADLEWDFEGVGDDHPWSAVFISWCIKTAGAEDSEFNFSNGHSQFVYRCIQNRQANVGVFQAYMIGDLVLSVGDIIQNNRSGAAYSYEYASTHPSYNSHSAIVIALGENLEGKFAVTVGGNEHDTVGVRIVNLTAEGKVAQRGSNPYICVIKNLK